MTTQSNLITGIQASGDLHLGSYLGTMAQWQEYTQSHHCTFFIADLHALTTKKDPADLREKTLDMLAMFLACGIDTEHHTVFVQSQVPQHAELGWVMSCIASTGELNRMTQFKDKSQKGSVSSVGLYTYPCLMAADILLHQADKVPVGEDQKQHLELARNLAERFNRDYATIFTVPNPIIPKVAARVMALQEPTKKMSKSDDNQQNSIFLMDPPEKIVKKVKRAVTDSQATIDYDPERPGISNLVQIFAALEGKETADIVASYEGKGYAQFKGDLADCLVAKLTPLQTRYTAIRQDQNILQQAMQRGAEKAREQAAKTLQKAYQAVGLVGL